MLAVYLFAIVSCGRILLMKAEIFDPSQHRQQQLFNSFLSLSLLLCVQDDLTGSSLFFSLTMSRLWRSEGLLILVMAVQTLNLPSCVQMAEFF